MSNVDENTLALANSLHVDLQAIHPIESNISQLLQQATMAGSPLGQLLAGIYTTVAPTLTDGKVAVLRLSADGKLQVQATPVPPSVAFVPVSGSVNVAAGPVKTVLGSAQIYQSLTIVAKITNLSSIVLGDTGAQLFQMEPGRDVTLTNIDISTLYINGTAGEGVTYIGLK